MLGEIISSKLKVKYSCLNAYLSKSHFTRGTEKFIIILFYISVLLLKTEKRSTL